MRKETQKTADTCSVMYKLGETIKKKKPSKYLFKQFKIELLLSQENSESFTWYKYFTGREAKSVHNRKISKPKAVTKLGCQQLQLSLQSRTYAAHSCAMLPGNLHSLQGGSSTASWLDCSWLAGKPEGVLAWAKLELRFQSESAWQGNPDSSSFNYVAMGVESTGIFKLWPLFWFLFNALIVEEESRRSNCLLSWWVIIHFNN